jgi:hypothetical protein
METRWLDAILEYDVRKHAAEKSDAELRALEYCLNSLAIGSANRDWALVVSRARKKSKRLWRAVDHAGEIVDQERDKVVNRVKAL